MKYVPLNIKTHNTLLSSMIKIEELINKAKKLKIDCLSINDTNMYGVMDFYNLCLKNNIKPIIGLTINIDSLDIVLYAKNEKGYKNLIKICTNQTEKNLEINDIKDYDELICIVPFASLKIYDNLKQIFNEIFIGYKNVEERTLLRGDNLIYFNEILYLEKEDEEYIKYLFGIRDGQKFENIQTDKTKNYLLSYEEYKEKYADDLKNNEYIYNNCNIKISKNDNLIPEYNCPNNMDSYTYLKELCKEGLKHIFGDSVNRVYIDRLKYELNVINSMGFCDYFLIVYDYVKFAKEKGILVGPGRGSAAGSLVSYLLNITTIDPIKYNLLFERFLNPERITMPDIDIDFEYTRREEVINYCMHKYGMKNVAPIITFGTLGCKQAIRDVGRVMDIDLKVIDNICKKVDSNLSLKDNYKQNEELKKIINLKEDLKKLFLVASKLEGIKRHTSIHAAGVVMCKKPLDEIIPLDKSHEDFYITGYDMTYLEEIGLLKMDFLALKNLTIINDCLKDINITFDDIPINDEKAIKIFTNVNTIGIFQFDSKGMMNFIKKFRPNSFDDIVSAVALFRPGPMNSIDSFIKRKKGLEKIDYIDDSLINILKPTYGIIIYQEQIMQIVSIMAGYSYGEADILRRAMSKKKEEVMLNKREDFIKRSIDNGYSKETSEKVYDLILKFASYGFNKAHSVSYAMLAYKMAYLKAHYPVYFMKQLLNSSIGSEEKIREYIYECKKNNINLQMPDVNKSFETFEVTNGTLICPLTMIKGINSNIVKKIIDERNKCEDLFDFISYVYDGKIITTKIIENLIKAGALSSFGYSRKTLICNLDEIINYGEIGSLLSDSNLKPSLTLYDEYENSELLKNELDVYGFYLSKHPVTEFKLKYQNIVDLEKIEDYFDKNISIIVYVDSIRETNTKNNEKMAFINGSDEIKQIDIIIFPKIYRNIDKINDGNILYIDGKVQKRFDKYQVVANKIQILR